MVQLVLSILSTVLLVDWPGLVGDSLQESRWRSQGYYLVWFATSIRPMLPATFTVDDVVLDPTGSDWMPSPTQTMKRILQS